MELLLPKLAQFSRNLSLISLFLLIVCDSLTSAHPLVIEEPGSLLRLFLPPTIGSSSAAGGASLDYLVTVDSFPKPDEKIRSTSFKVASDSEGRRKTRTAIYHPRYPPMIPDDISNSSMSATLDGGKLVYFDGLSLKTALAVAMEASRKSIPILVDAEMGEEGFEVLLEMASYAVCSAKYFQAWTHAPSMSSALISMLLRLPNLKFVIVTLGEDGCIMLERSQIGMPPEKMLPFACQVAANCCRALGARTGLPRPTDEMLVSFFHQRRGT